MKKKSFWWKNKQKEIRENPKRGTKNKKEINEGGWEERKRECNVKAELYTNR